MTIGKLYRKLFSIISVFETHHRTNETDQRLFKNTVYISYSYKYLNIIYTVNHQLF